MDELEVRLGWHYDKPFFQFNEMVSYPYVAVSASEGFNAQLIQLDGTLRSNLEWNEARAQADKSAGILWQMDLGLFDRLLWPLPDSSQFQTLLLALHHFRDKLHKDYQEKTIGLAIYQGPLPTEAECSYLALLAAHLPDEIPVFAFIDMTSTTRSIENEQRLASLHARRVLCATKGESLPIRQFSWESGSSFCGFIGSKYQPVQETTLALLLPEGKSPKVEATYQEWIQNNRPFRLITEETLLTEWVGLDELYYDPSSTTAEGLRKIHGFHAAGGLVHTL